MRGFGWYRHSWRATDNPHEDRALSVTFVMRGRMLWQLIDCIDATKDRCGGE
jgi:hypothetical protein